MVKAKIELVKKEGEHLKQKDFFRQEKGFLTVVADLSDDEKLHLLVDRSENNQCIQIAPQGVKSSHFGKQFIY